jgi:primosomal protein N' (replication factor Y)
MAAPPGGVSGDVREADPPPAVVDRRAPGPDAARGSLLEVAVALPVRGTFTYRDPRGAQPVPIGTQVVVPFGQRTVTGFVVAHAATVTASVPATAASPGAVGTGAASRARAEVGNAAVAARDIEAVVAGPPAFDDEMIGFCRWAADYYQAPLGEVLRAALPHGEKAIAVRSVRLTEAGRRALHAQPELPGGGGGADRLGGFGGLETTGPSDPGRRPGAAAAPSGPPGLRLLAALAAAGGQLTSKALSRLDARAAAHVGRLCAQGLAEVGDAVQERRPPPAVPFAVAADDRAAARARIPARAPARRALFEKLAAAPQGLPAATLTPAERAHLKALVAAGAARIDRRSRPAAADRDRAAAPADRSTGDGPLTATSAQQRAVTALGGALAQGFATFVLHGVTGSGKTEVYLRVIAEARRAGRGALVLVPEIALTPQLAGRFRARFGDDVAVLHSALPPGERLAAWRKLRAGEVGIAVGARSAVFAPVQGLGVVVVDEEHDGSFKQDDGFRYNARDLAVVRAQRAGAVAILGSATPSLESFHNAQLGRFQLIALPERATPRPLPVVEVIDLRRHPAGADGLLSPVLAEAMAANLAAREQTILFLNRRGFSTVVLCRACGQVVHCENCAVSMTYHQSRGRLICHYCARTTPVPARCPNPSCASPQLERLGMGTERVEALVRARFPEARIARLDRDTAGERGAAGGAPRGLGAVLEGMQAGAIDILVGTQMVTKGHDFAGVTLVGVLLPDQGMHLPDFRAAERTFQLIEQVAGRAGRGDRPGRVIIQTYTPEHAAITAVRTHDYAGFVRQELELRREADYPPFSRMIVLRLDGRDQARVAADAAQVAAATRAVGGGKVRVLGPAEAPIARVRGRARYQVWLAGRERSALVAAARAGAAVKLGPDVRLAIDIDPQSVL